MEIKIDTTKDSREDIRKAIRLLQSLIDEYPESGSSSPAQFPQGENVLGGFFDSAESSMQPLSETPNPTILEEKTPDSRESKSKKFSIGSAGGFDVY